MVYNEVDALSTLLGYQVQNAGCCKVVFHPKWGSSVYPSTLFAVAPRDEVQFSTNFFRASYRIVHSHMHNPTIPRGHIVDAFAIRTNESFICGPIHMFALFPNTARAQLLDALRSAESALASFP